MTFIDYDGILIVAEVADDSISTIHYLSSDSKKYDDFDGKLRWCLSVRDYMPVNHNEIHKLWDDRLATNTQTDNRFLDGNHRHWKIEGLQKSDKFWTKLMMTILRG